MSEFEPVPAEVVPIEPPPLPVGGPPLEYVGFRRRAAARLLDLLFHYAIGIVAGVTIAILAYFVQGLTGRPAQPILDVLGKGPLGFLTALLGGILFDAIMEGFHGSTLGKRLVGITVLDESARPCNFKAATIRSFAFLFDGLLFGVVAQASMRDSPTQQRYGDRWAHTVVVFRRSVPEGSLRSSFRFGLVLMLASFADGLLILLEPLMMLVS
jgi:uncharacterized RDD family membrane protein YckC